MGKYTLPIRGMHCAACSGRIERAVGKMEGVVSVAVNLAAETMDIRLDPATQSLDRVAERVAELGFTAVLPEKPGVVRLGIGGMHCASCSGRIEKVVGAMDGVAAMRVNLASETGELELAPGGPALEVVLERIAELGFTATPLADDDRSLFEVQQREQAERLSAMRANLGPQLVLGALVLLAAMGPMVGLPVPAFMDPAGAPAAYALVQLALTAPLVWLGRRFYLDGVPALMRGGPNMDSLIALGTGAALTASLWSTAQILARHAAAHAVHQLYYESAAVIIALVSLGKYFEARSKARTTEAVKALLTLAPDTAVVLQDGLQRVAPVKELRPGQLVLVRPGERIPVDGVVEEGAGEVDESMLTGENAPVYKGAGDNLAAGTQNALGALVMRVSRVGQDTVLARIIRLVRDAQGSKAPMANLADRVSLYFVPVVMGLAAAAGAAWALAGADAWFCLRVVVSVLVIACPCAMGLAVPTSIMVGTGRGARLGVLIKSGAALEAAGQVQAVVFDKTGTLTMGKPAVTEVHAVNGFDADALMAQAAAAESLSEHPLGQAVVREALARGLTLPRAANGLAVPGQGVSAQVGASPAGGDQAGQGQTEPAQTEQGQAGQAQAGQAQAGQAQAGQAQKGQRQAEQGQAGQAQAPGVEVLVGRAGFLEGRGASVPGELVAEGHRLAAEGQTPLYVAVGGLTAGLVGVADQLRPEAPAVVAELQSMGVAVYMLTGDSQAAAKAQATKAGIHNVVAEVPPEGKAAKVAELKASGLRVAMVGDGVNDAPALATADVGIAMGSGIDVAIEAGDVVLMRADLGGVLTALKLSQATVRNIKQNLFWAFAYNVLGIPVAAGVLTLFGGPPLSPMIAGAAMAASSVSVVSNALRLRLFKG